MFRRILPSVVSVSAALVLALVSLSASAQATRTWVSGVGDDANPCSRTAPCKTFAGAISKTAARGEISVLDPGGFGAVTITKAITIDGAGTNASILAAGSNGVIINAGVNDVVVLRNLSINGVSTGLNGIRFLAGAALHVENVVISGFTQRGIEVLPTASSNEVFLKNVDIHQVLGTGAGGILLRPTAPFLTFATLDQVRLDNNNFGLRAEVGATALVRRSTFSGNLLNGLLAFTGGVIAIDSSSIVGNGSIAGSAGIKSEGAGAVVRISNNLISGNVAGVLAASSGQIISLGNNTLAGNTTDGNPTSTIVTR